MKEVIVEIQNRFKEDLIFIGLRGSFCVGLDDENFDKDYLVVTKGDAVQYNKDIMIYNIKKFNDNIKLLSFELIEAIFNEIYCTNEFKQNFNNIRTNILNNLNNPDFKGLFNFQIWSMLKNQLKQFKKDERKNKFASKSVLFFRLLDNNYNILEFYSRQKEIPKELRNEYFKIRQEGFKTYEDELEQIWLMRTNNDIRKEWANLREKALKNSEFKKLNICY